MIKDLIGKNQNYLHSLPNETDKMRYEVSYFAWQEIDTLKQFKLEEPIRDLSLDDFIKKGIHTFECNVVPPDCFCDHYIVGIADALRESKKAKQITLHFGQTRDSAMQYFLKAVEETEAPLESIKIDTVRGITDKTWELFPKLIRSKGVKINLANVNISDEIKKRIDIANKSIDGTETNIIIDKSYNR